MNKRYQVFVSSTYSDLREERNVVIHTLMEMDCIPSGMELFPAADEDQMDFIKKVIDDCDYYLLIIGARYGSTTSEGISYTEKEYDYAVSKGMKVVALIHGQPDSLPVGKTDKDPALGLRLQAFREKVQTGRLVKFWSATSDLPGLVALSVSKAMTKYPAVGWVRGNATASTELLEEVNELRKKNDELQKTIATMNTQFSPAITDLAGLDVKFKLRGTFKTSFSGQEFQWDSDLMFGEMFALIAPALIEVPNEALVESKLAMAILHRKSKKPVVADIDLHAFQTLRIQLQALGLTEVEYSQSTTGKMALFWQITKRGHQVMVDLRVVRQPKIQAGSATSSDEN